MLANRGLQNIQGQLSGAELLESWRYQVDPEKAGDTGMVVGFEFTDSGDAYTVELRNSILEITPGPVAADLPVVRISAAQLREAMEGKPLPPGAGATGELQNLLAYLDLSPPEIFMHLR